MRLLAASCDLAHRPLLVARDPDTGGRRAALRDYQVLAPFCPAATTPVLPGTGDPADIYQHGGAAALAAALRSGEHPLADLAVDAALAPFAGGLERKEAEAQVAAVRAAARLLAATRPADMAQQVVRVAGRTGILHWEVAGEFAAAAAAAEPRPKGQAPDGSRPPAGPGDEFPAAPGRVRTRPGRHPAHAGHQPGRQGRRR
jgi:DNA primase